MIIIRRIILIILSVPTGGVFLYSAYTKLTPIQTFEYTIVEYAHFSWLFAAITARFLIGVESALGALLILNFYGYRKWVLKAALVLVALFSLYLIYLWYVVGNDINCGCFGDAIWMSPSSSLIKNIVLLTILWILLRYNKGFVFRWSNIISPLLLVGTIIIVYSIYYIPINEPNWLRKDHYRIDFSVLYDSTKSDKPAIDLSKGKHIVGFFSQSCPHCRLTAYKMHLMKIQDTTLPFFMIIGGTSDLADFWKTTKAQNIPYTRLDKDNFLKYTGGIFPLIVLVNDGWVEAKTDYVTMDQAELAGWVAQKTDTLK